MVCKDVNEVLTTGECNFCITAPAHSVILRPPLWESHTSEHHRFTIFDIFVSDSHQLWILKSVHVAKGSYTRGKTENNALTFLD